MVMERLNLAEQQLDAIGAQILMVVMTLQMTTVTMAAVTVMVTMAAVTVMVTMADSNGE